MNNIMVDIETMGQGSNAAIVAIGAVVFDTSGTGDEFYARISLEDAAKYGDIEASTVLWWMAQNEAARGEITKRDGVLQLSEVLYKFSLFIHRHQGSSGANIWGNGSDFDNVIIENAYKKVGRVAPWNFWNNRCYRTMKSTFRDVKLERNGVHHKAIDDARYQAMHLIEIANKHNIEL